MSVTREFYLERAASSRREAEASSLENVRDRCLRAAAAWEQMAARIARSDRLRAEEEERKAARALAEQPSA
jgi:hypothetical protein